MNKLQFNIYCGTTEEAISEVEKLEKAFDKPIECYVNIVMDEQKEPIDLTLDSEKFVKAIKDGSLEYHDPTFTLNRK